VLATAQRMLHDREVLRQELHALEERPSGNLVVGAVPTAMPIAVRFTARLRARHPGIAPTLRSLSSAEIEAGIESLSLDDGGRRSAHRALLGAAHAPADPRPARRQRRHEFAPLVADALRLHRQRLTPGP
jgi:hypothetical protein